MHVNHVRRSTRPVVRASLAILAAGALLLGACGDDDADATAGSTTTTAADNGEGSSSASDAEALVGSWAHPENGRTNTFTADGEYFVSDGEEVLAEGTYTATSTTVEFVGETGPIACEETGTYEWEVEDDTLTLTVVEDDCTGRRSGLDGVTRERVETVPAPTGAGLTGDEKQLPQGPSEVSAGDTLATSNLGGLRFVAPEDRTVYQAPGFIVIGDEPAVIDLVSVVETLDGEPIDSVDTVVALIEEATVTLDEAVPTIIAGHEARVFDFTAAPERQPRPEWAVFRFEQGGVGGWGPVGEGRVWLLDTPRGILLLGAAVLEPGQADLADVIAEAETIFATLELVEVGT